MAPESWPVRRTSPAREIDEESFHRLRQRDEIEAAAPGADLRSRPVQVRGRQVAGVQLVDQQRADVFLRDGPLRAAAVASAERRGDAFHAEFACPHERAMQLDPLRRNPVLVPAHAQLRIGAVVMDEPREEDRHVRFPASEARRRERVFEHVLIRRDEALRKVQARLPDPLGHLWRGLEAFDVLLEQLAAVGAERCVGVLQCLRACKVHRTPRLAQSLECPQHQLLPRDNVERRQIVQPGRGGLRRHERVAGIPHTRVQESEHGTSAKMCASARWRRPPPALSGDFLDKFRCSPFMFGGRRSRCSTRVHCSRSPRACRSLRDAPARRRSLREPLPSKELASWMPHGTIS
jgi:hypothetical protein